MSDVLPVTTEVTSSVKVSSTNSLVKLIVSASQKILRLIWNPNVHDHFHKVPPLVNILGKMNAVHNLSAYFYEIHSTIIAPPSPGLPSGLLPSGLFHQKFVRVYFSHACPLFNTS